MTTLRTGISELAREGAVGSLTGGRRGGCGRRFGRRRRGFTLLELTLVLILISVVLALTAPNLRGFRYGAELDGEARQLVSLTKYARAQAAAKGMTYVVRAADVTVQGENGPEVRREWQALSVDEETNGVPAGESLARLSSEGVQIDLTGSDGGALEAVEFYPDGTMTPGKFHLVGQGGEKWVTCISRVEGFRITDEQGVVQAR
jgi:type II secretion system protein H